MNKTCCPHCGGGNWIYINGAPHCKKHRMCNKIPMLGRLCEPDILIVQGKIRGVSHFWQHHRVPLSPRAIAVIERLLKDKEPSTLTLIEGVGSTND